MLARLTPLRLFLAIGPLLYLAFALITPPFQTPDEHQHLFRAWQLADGRLHGARQGDRIGGMVPRGLVMAAAQELGTAAPHAERKVVTTGWAERWSRATPLESQARVFADFVGSAAYAPVGYGPQVVAIGIGRALGLSVEAIVRLGRVGNALLTVLLLCGAFRALPAGRLVLLVVALLPMTAACAGSFGQDGLVIGASAWLVALGARAWAERGWKGRGGALAVGLAVALTLAKFVYLPLAGLGLFAHGDRRRLGLAGPPLVAGLVAVGMLVLWLLYTAGLVAPMMPGRPSPGVQAAWLAHHPLAFLAILGSTYDTQGSLFLVQKLFTFGWLNVGPAGQAIPLTGLALVLAMAAGDAGAGKLSRSWRGWALLVSAATFILLSLALYLTASPLGADYVHGLQGRYYIPLFLPVLLCLLLPRRQPLAIGPLGVALLMVGANVAALSTMIHAWYG